MKHQVKILKESFLNCDYTDNENCALAIALKKRFPKAKNIWVGFDHFRFNDPKLGWVVRNFDSCKVESIHYSDSLCELVYDFSNNYKEKSCDVVFNFKTL